MMQGTYYKEWSRMLGREMEFKVYGTAGVPVLALPARGGRFYDWENNGMPEAVASLLSSGKLQLFTADGIDAESLLAGDAAPRRRAEMQEKYFNYLSTELAARIRELNQTEKGQRIWCVGVDTGACQAVNCRLRRPKLFAGAIGLSGIYDLARFWGSEADDLVLRCSPLQYLAENGIADKLALAKAKEKGVKVVMSPDALIADAFSADANTNVAPANNIPDGWEGVDIADEGKKVFREEILKCKTILWNGPVGVFEIDKFATGSRAVAEAIAEATSKGAYSLIGGGDSVACINKFGLADQVSYISTGGGALLEYIEFGDLPGVAAIRD